MTTLFTVLGTFFTVMGFFGLWGPVLRPTGLDMGSIAFADIVSLWGGLALLCVAAALVLFRRRQSRYNSED